VAPDNKPALDRMMQFWSDAANLDPNSPQVFDLLNSTAKKLFAADPRNTAAEAAVYSSVVRPWLAGVETDTARIVEAVAKLEALMERDPANAELPMFIAQAKLRLAERARQRSPDAPEAKQLTAEANGVMERALKSRPDSAAMYFSAAKVAQAQETGEDGAEFRKKRREYYAKAVSW
jgi:hypothetical protein